MTRHWRPATRFLLLVLAATVATAPAVASIIDARAEALALSDRFSSHVDESGSRHDHRVHVDDCPLCRLATQSAVRRSLSVLPLVLAAFKPTPDARIPRPLALESRWSAPSRDPPLA